MTQCLYKSTKNANVKITAIEWVNGHDLAMVMTGADDGSVKLWKMPNAGSKEMTLISAWQAFADMAPPPSFKLGGVGFSGKQTVIIIWNVVLLKNWACKPLKVVEWREISFE